MVRVAVQQGQRLLREGLRVLLEAQDDIMVIGTAANGGELLELCEESSPQVVVAEVDSPGWDVCRVAAALRQRVPGVRMVGLYQALSVDRARDVRRAGVLSLLPRAAGMAPILKAVRNQPQAVIPLRPLEGPLIAPLTPREVTVLSLIGTGCTSGEVGRELQISPKTVENHKQRIFRKLGVQNQAHAVSVAMRQGFIATARTGELAL